MKVMFGFQDALKLTNGYTVPSEDVSKAKRAAYKESQKKKKIERPCFFYIKVFMMPTLKRSL